MTDTRRALRRNILENPCDDLPRLVYADFLEETGDEDDVTRALFIREGVANPRRRLKDRYHGGFVVTWARGFVYAVRTTPTDWPHSHSTFFTAHPITRVYFRHVIRVREYGRGDDHPVVYREAVGEEMWRVMCPETTAADTFVDKDRRTLINGISYAAVVLGRRAAGLSPLTPGAYGRP